MRGGRSGIPGFHGTICAPYVSVLFWFKEVDRGEMAHDVFISHSARDKPYADAVCAKLESRGIRCWIAPRDIRAGMDYGTALLEAIDGARVMLLVLSSHANGSAHISREVERAVNKGLVVMPVRIEDIKPTGDLEYFLATPHWLDAITPPFERHLESIGDSAKFWLDRLATDAAGSVEARVPQTTPPQPIRIEPTAAAAPTVIAHARTRPKWIVPAIAALVIALVGTAAFFGARYYLAQQQLAPEAKHKRLAEADAQVDRIIDAIQLGIAPELAGTPEPAYVDAIRDAAKSGDPEQQRRLGNLYTYGLGVPKDFAEALSWLRKSAAQGNAGGEFRLGVMYQNGRGVPKDYDEALRWFRKAAEQGAPNAEVGLGSMYVNGWGVPKDNDEAVRWFRKAAEQGNADGEIALGLMYKNGFGVGKDYDEAVRWFRKAAEQGNALGEASVAAMYTLGLGVPKDYDEAVRWFRKAAEQGEPNAEAGLGLMYTNGWGVPKDYDETVRWFRKAAEQGNAIGEYNLGGIYANGRGVPKDYDEAARWYRKAAEQGDADSEYQLGIIYQNGWGVPRDLTEAKKWYGKAAAQGNELATQNLKKLQSAP